MNWRYYLRSLAAEVSFLSELPLDLDSLIRQVSGAGHGAVTTFTGTVRDHHGGRPVVRLTYSAYVEMAESECAAIVAEASLRWTIAVALQHRLGQLVVGDPAVIIAVGSAHRDAGFEACRWVIDAVKERVPIWKHEFFADGTSEWVDPTRSIVALPSAPTASH